MSILDDVKITYFPLSGRAESLRLALTIAGINFSEESVTFPEWGAKKETTPWGSLPTIDLSNGTRLSQQRAILRFIGKHTGIYPEDPVLAARCDELMDAMEDMQSKTNDAGRGLPKEEKEAARKETATTGALSFMFKKLDAYIGEHGSNGHTVGDKLTVSDILLFCLTGIIISGFFDGIPSDTLVPFPNIQKVRKTVGTIPEVMAYYDSLGDKATPTLKNTRDL
eukprot:m.254190 g.254190  ORF g.254190 m.254190 type:complete len:224 (+) comp16168_c0_seq6:102-773(+)